MFIINRSQSPFGGDGSARFFLNWGSPPYQTISYAPQYDRKDSLAYNPGTSGWTRWTPEGRTVAFNSQGQHTSTTNRFGRVTAFGYAGSLLSSISLPAPTGMSYGFGYTSGRLTSVTAPPIGAQARVTTLGNPAGQLVSIRNPGDSVVLFRYKPAAADLHLIDQRTNRRSVSTSFTYDAARRVATSSVTPGGGAGIITWALTHGETRGLMGVPAVGAVTRAQHDGCGGVDADCSWLVFRLDNPVGHKTLFDWDFFGLAKGTLNVVTSTRDTSLTLTDVTRYEWDPTFNQLTKIVPPEGDSMRFGVNPSNGRREWQEDARGTTSRINFIYSPFSAFPELPSSVILPAIGGSSVNLNYTYHSTLANLWQETSGRGEVSTYTMDGIGRVMSVESPIDSGASTTRMVRVATGYSVRGDRTADTTITVNTTPAERIVVHSFFNGEGQPDSVHRSVSPDAAFLGVMRTRWIYDLAGRTTQTIAADNKVDSAVYDEAGNVTRAVNRRFVAGTIDTAQYVRMEYDAVGRLTKRIIPRYTYPAITNGLGHAAYTIVRDSQYFAYSILGQIDTANNRYAHIARSYSPRGEVLTEIAKINTVIPTATGFNQHVYTTHWRYDAQGRRIAIKLPSQLMPAGKDSIRYTYTNFGALHQVYDPLGVQLDHVYNARTELESITNVTGNYAQSWQHDDNGDVVVDRVQNLGLRTWPRFTTDTLRQTRVALDGRGKLLLSRDRLGYRDTLTVSYGGLGALDRSHLVQHAALAYNLAGAPPTAVRLVSVQDPTQDAFGNIVSDVRRDTLRIGTGTPSILTDLRSLSYLAGTGRLNQEVDGAYVRAHTYDSSGNTSRTFRAGGGRPAYDNASYYDASGRLVAAENRWEETTAVGNGMFTTEEYRHDALGRRVWVRRHRDCDGVGDSYYQPQWCGLSLIRRTVWDGERELLEIQAPGDSTEPAFHEVDTGLALLPLLGALDRNPYFGRVVYTHGPTLDRPVALTRLGYADAATSAGSPWPAFTVVPYWNRRGQAAIGTYGGGQWGLQFAAGGTRCAASATSGQRCVVLEWPVYWSAFDARRSTELLSWHGTLLEDKVNGTGTYYRRARVYDGQTGRFTQEDPIGLAGGMNLYGYANGDPVNFSDPFGLMACPPYCDVFQQLAAWAPAMKGLLTVGAAVTMAPAVIAIGADAAVAGVGMTVLNIATKAGGAGPAIAATIHGAQRMADPSRLNPAQAAQVMNNFTQRFVQGGGAQVYIEEVSGKFNVVIHGDRGVINVFKNLSEKSLARLGRYFEWTAPK